MKSLKVVFYAIETLLDKQQTINHDSNSTDLNAAPTNDQLVLWTQVDIYRNRYLRWCKRTKIFFNIEEVGKWYLKDVIWKKISCIYRKKDEHQNYWNNEKLT